MSKQILGRYENEWYFNYLRRLINEFPGVSLMKIKEWAKESPRIRSNIYKRHQGEQEKARRRMQMQKGIIS